MSLQVWLPLNGNLNNNGVANVTITNNGATVNADGKIGSCYYFNGSFLTFNNPLSSPCTQFSIAGWVKLNTGYAINNGFHIVSFQETYNRICISKDGAAVRVLLKGDGANVVVSSSALDSTIAANIWKHYAIIFDTGKIRIYIDGQLDSETAVGVSSITFPNIVPRIGTYSTENANGCINDFRLYDHALSPKEVKEISKGLILHMPLDNNGAGCNNILPNTSAVEVRYNYPVNTSTYQDQFAAVTSVVPSGSQYCLSFFAKSTVNGDKIRAHYYSPNTTTKAESNQGVVSTASDGNIDITLSTEWKQYYIVYTQSSTTAVKHVILPRMFGSAREEAAKGSGTVSIRCLKLEEGNKPTPWCPNTADALYSSLGFNSSTVYDTSGYGNNGTMSSTKPTIASDAPRYSSSMLFANGTYISTTLPSVTGFANTYTFAWWARTSNYDGDKMFWGFSNGNRLNLYGTGGVYCWNTGDSANNKFGTTSVAGESDNNWHHFAVTSDGTTVKLYIDGTFKANAKTFRPITGTTICLNGWDAGATYKFNGSLSDYRLYTTCLSADDIAELYKVPISIDNTGKVHAIEFNEV